MFTCLEGAMVSFGVICIFSNIVETVSLFRQVYADMCHKVLTGL